MQDAILKLAQGMDAVIMAAAVGDYRPEQVSPQKIKKEEGEMTVRLQKNPDILLALGRAKSSARAPVLVGFAAETENLDQNATEKLARKNLDFIVANNLTQAGSGFGVDTNQVRIYTREGTREELPFMSKEEVAEQILGRVEHLMTAAGHEAH
jgi:phosphopantothenoylcysteine decarboxylase/phosphopantothenate--cysteine ligase